MIMLDLREQARTEICDSFGGGDMRRFAVTMFLMPLATVFLNGLFVADVDAQGVTVGNGVIVSLGDSTVRLNCNDLTIQNGGTVNAQSAILESSRHLTINSGGTLNGENAAIRLCGTWTMYGTFVRGASTVTFYSGCGVSNLVAGLPIPTTGRWGAFVMAALIVAIGCGALRWRMAA